MFWMQFLKNSHLAVWIMRLSVWGCGFWEKVKEPWLTAKGQLYSALKPDYVDVMSLSGCFLCSGHVMWCQCDEFTPSQWMRNRQKTIHQKLNWPLIPHFCTFSVLRGSEKNAYYSGGNFFTLLGLTVPLLNDQSMVVVSQVARDVHKNYPDVELDFMWILGDGTLKIFLDDSIYFEYITNPKSLDWGKWGKGENEENACIHMICILDMDMIHSLTTKALIREWIWTHPRALCLECHWSLEEFFCKTSDVCPCCQSAFLFSTSTQVESIQTDS